MPAPETTTARRVPCVWQLGRPAPHGLVDRWRDLARRVEGSSYFQTPEWMLAWWNTVGEQAPTSVSYFTGADDTLDAVVGLSEVRHRIDRRLPGSVAVTVNAGSGPGDADHCGPLVDAAQRDVVSRWLARQSERDTLLLRHCDRSTAALLPHRTRRLETFACPRLEVVGEARDMGRSSNFRRQIGRYTRRLQAGGVAFEWIPAGAVEHSVISTLLSLHRERRTALRSGSSLDARYERLLHELVESGRDGSGLGAVVARIAGREIGVLVGFRWQDTFAAYQSGWSPEFAAQSLGTVLVSQAIRLAVDDGARSFDFLRGQEDYKYRFGAVDRWDSSYLVPRGVTGGTLILEHGVRRTVQRLQRSRTSPKRTGRRAVVPG